MKAFAVACLLILAVAPAGARAASDEDLDYYGPDNDWVEERRDEWTEAVIRLPPWPRDAALAPIPVPAADPRLRFLIDTASVSVGADRVVRYTVVITNTAGFRNVLFEGLRCRDGAYKSYAYGTAAGQFRRHSAPRWRHATERGSGSYRSELRRHYFCDNGNDPKSRRRIVDNLERLSFRGDNDYDPEFD